MNKTEELLIALLKSQIFSKKIDENTKNNLTEEYIEKIWNLSGIHSLSPIIASAFIDNNLYNEELRLFFSKEIFQYMRESESQDYELNRICKVLNNEKIYHLPLKGSIIKKMYPQPWMRTSCDIDILIHKEDLEKTIDILKDQLNYRFESKCLHDVSLRTPGNLHIELHYLLIEHDRLKTNILSDVWDYTSSQPKNEYTKIMSDDMFYFYHIAHMVKHFKSNGFGIRHLVDMWILNRYIEYDRTKRDFLLEKGNLKKFENALYNLCEILFDNKPSDELSDIFIDYIFNSGTYGSLYNNIALNRINNKKSNLKYYIQRIFMPYNQLKTLYPSLEKKKILYPFYCTKRWFRILLYKNHKNVVNEFQTNSALSNNKIKKIEDIYKKVDL